MSAIQRGVDLISQERERQMIQHGWTEQHDDGHGTGELAKAALVYASLAEDQISRQHVLTPPPPECWPWAATDWRPSPDAVRNLVKAGALIAAEIDRLQRKRILDAVFTPLS